MNKERNQKWFLQNRNCYSNDLKKYYSLLKKATNKFSLKKLGMLGDFPLYLISHSNKGKNITIISGIHGDEPAGPWAILNFIEKK